MTKRFLVKAICAPLLCVLCVSAAQSQTLVTITDTLKNADGTNAAGRVVISWNPFTAASGETIDGGTLTYTITDGVVSLSLAPNAGATPAGTSYRAQYYLTNRASYRETWVIPATGPVTIADIRVSVVPSPTVTFNAATQLTNFDMSAQTFTRPVKLGTTLPATCTLGDLFVDTDLTPAGQQLYICTAADTWTLVGDGGGAGGGITSLEGQTGATQTFTDDTNVTIVSASNAHVITWAGLLGLARGGTNADLSATGGANQFLKQSSSGAAITVGTIADADVPDSITVTLAATATALAANGANCAANQFNKGVDASGAAESCAALLDADVPDTITASSYLPLVGGTMTGELALRAAGAALSGGGLVDCDTAGTSKLLWDVTTARFSCGTDQTGGGSAHDILSATHTDTTAATVSRGSLVVGKTATPVWEELVIGTANQVLATDGTDAAWTSLGDAHIPNTITIDLATTATALAANGANCSANQFNKGVDASGAAESCAALLDADVPDTITLTNVTQITNRAISDTSGTLLVPRGGSGATTLTGLLQGNGASPFTAITNSSTVGQILRVTGASAYGWGALDLADGDAVTGLLPDGNIAASLMRDSELAAFTVTKTNLTLDAEGTGNTLTIPALIHYTPAVCQNATATLGMNTPTTNAAEAGCVTGTNTQRGVADFDAATDESLQGNFRLRDWSGNIEVVPVWHAAATSGNVDWNVQIACVDDAETGDPSWDEDVLSIVDAAKGTANQFNDATGTLSSSTHLSTCTSGDTLFFRFFRDADDGTNDTMTGDARLVSLVFVMRRAM